MAETSQPDYMDPALSYTVNGWEPLSTVYTGLVAYKRAEGEEGSQLIPGLAQELPKVSEDGLTVIELATGHRVYSTDAGRGNVGVVVYPWEVSIGREHRPARMHSR